MWFTTKASGTDYINVSMDVHRDQLFEVVKAITDVPDRPGWRRAQGTADTVDENTVRRLASGLTEGRAAALWADGLPPVCVVCDRTIQRGDRRSGNGLAFAVDPTTDEVVAVCRHCAAYSKDVEPLTDYLRSGRVPRTSGDSAPAGWWSGPGDVVRRDPAAAGEAEGTPRALRVDGHGVDERGHGGGVGPGALHWVMRDDREAGRAEQERGELGSVVLELHIHENTALRGSQAADHAEKSDKMVGGVGVDVDTADSSGRGEEQARVAGFGHGGSSDGWETARVKRSHRRRVWGDVTEPTERPASLEDVVELLREVVDRMGPKPFLVDFSSAGRAAAWLRVSDEHACRAVDAEDDTELDCEGPGAEGVDGGEDR